MRTGVRRVTDGGVSGRLQSGADARTPRVNATEIRHALIPGTSKDTFNTCISSSLHVSFLRGSRALISKNRRIYREII